MSLSPTDYRAFNDAHLMLYGCPEDVDRPSAGHVADLLLGKVEPVSDLERWAVQIFGDGQPRT